MPYFFLFCQIWNMITNFFSMQIKIGNIFIIKGEVMDSLIQQLTDNPILLVATLILIAIGGFTLVKRLWKPTMFLLILLTGYIVYLVITEQEMP